MSIRKHSSANLLNTSARKQGRCEGFSIVEAVIIAVILAVGTTTSLILFTFTSSQNNSARQSQATEEALRADIASIAQFNERMTCSAGTGCTISNNDLGENNYAPTTTSNDFILRCRGTSNRTLGNEAADLLTLQNVPTPTAFLTLGITRSAPVAEAFTATSTDNPTHRYTVTWNRNGNRIRQLTFTPRVAAWCP